MTGSNFNLCPAENVLKNRGLRFGVNFEYRCRIDAQQLVDAFMETEFFIPYLQFWSDNKSILYPVPILVQNFGKNNFDDISNWQLVRRFFFVDKVSSTKFLSFVKSVEIRVKVREDEENFGEIFPPLLVLNYDKISIEDYENQKLIDFKFSIIFSTQSDLSRSIEVSSRYFADLILNRYSGVGKYLITEMNILLIILNFKIINYTTK